MGECELLKFTHLTFDCYGTLIDWRNGVESNLGKLLERRGLRAKQSIHPIYVKLEAEQEGAYKSYKQILQDTAIAVGNYFHTPITTDEAKVFAETLPLWKPFPDTVNCLRQLGDRGYKRVILSNVDRDLLQKTMELNGLEVEGFVTAEDVGSYKPAPGHWDRFFREYGVSREEVLHVAQSIYHDILPTQRMGIANAWINRYGEEKPSDVNPTFVFSDLTGLANTSVLKS